MRNKSGLHKFVYNIYGFSFFNSLMMLSPIYAIFMQENGVSDVQLSVLFMLFSGAIAISQLPVAWLNRHLGHKKTILFGQMLKMACFVLWFAVPNYYGFAAGFLLWGVQGATYNLAYEALLYDELKARRNCGIYAKVLGRRKVLSTIGGALSSAGSLLLFLGYNSILLATLVSLAVSVLFIMRLNTRADKPKIQKRKKKTEFLKLIKTGCVVVAKTPCILYMLLIATMMGNFAYADDYFTLIGLDIGIRKEFVGAIPFFIMCCKMVGLHLAHRFKKIKDFWLYVMISVSGLIFMTFSLFYSVPGLLLFGLAYVLFSILNILTYAKFQEFIPTVYRPIALSLYSMLDNIFYMWTLLMFGVGSVFGGWRYGILLLGLCSVLLGLWAIFFVREKCTIEQIPLNVRAKRIRGDSTSSAAPLRF